MKKIISTFITLKDKEIATLRIDNVDYISLTDLAKFKNSSNPADVINKWMTNKDSFDFYCLWEELFNPDFNLAESREIKINEVGYNAFTMSPTQWKKRTNAIGIVPSSGKYSIGTFAHPDIALEFSSWIDTAFRLYLIKEFERLKRSEAYQNDITWSIKRELAKTNYLIHTDAIKENIVPILTEKQKLFVYANEADVLNVALFGITAKEWRKQNPSLEGNIRDYASVLQLVVLVNLENLNANMIENNVSQKERLIKLNATAKKQLILLNTENVEKIENK
ncbi:MAG: KilA-N domain-containing protein [Bacilli bacterium]|nr:KilA-N domain-containing protein [Bacilli bacterium]